MVFYKKRQPLWYIDASHPNHVCCLKKAICGLKQAPRALFHHFSNFLITIGFNCSKTDYSLFVHSSDNDIIYLLLYMDDIVIIGNNVSLIDNFINKLWQEFSIKDLGNFNYFFRPKSYSFSKGNVPQPSEVWKRYSYPSWSPWFKVNCNTNDYFSSFDYWWSSLSFTNNLSIPCWYTTISHHYSAGYYTCSKFSKSIHVFTKRTTFSSCQNNSQIC